MKKSDVADTPRGTKLSWQIDAEIFIGYSLCLD